MIITLTLNPAIDKSAMVEKLTPGHKLRCENIVREPGGGGINVSKALRELGMESHAVFTAGGAQGQCLKKLVGERGIAYTAIDTGPDTRENLTVFEKQTLDQYRFVMPGAVLGEQEALQCLDAILRVRPNAGYVIISGSMPPGISEKIFQKITGSLKVKGFRVIADTSGAALQYAAASGIYLMKPNISELCTLMGVTRLSKEELLPAARSAIAKKYCEIMLVSLGSEGAVLVTSDLAAQIAAPEVKVLSTVGAGDSMVAGVAWMLTQGKTPLESARFGVACGAAATMNPGTRLFKAEDAFSLYQQLKAGKECH